jgi:hypothetical protein
LSSIRRRSEPSVQLLLTVVKLVKNLTLPGGKVAANPEGRAAVLKYLHARPRHHLVHAFSFSPTRIPISPRLGGSLLLICCMLCMSFVHTATSMNESKSGPRRQTATFSF